MDVSRATFEYGTILVAADEPAETLMILFRDDLANHEDWNALMLSGAEQGRIVWIPEEVLAGDDPTYVAAPR